MIWIIAFLCLGIVGLAGYFQGPVRAAFSLIGLVLGMALAGPLSPLTRHLLPLFGLHHPMWDAFMPQVLGFLLVLILFKIAGQIVHQKIAVFYKYQKDESRFYRWRRMYSRLGLCLGTLNGAVYFFLLMMPVYAGGYFTQEAQAEGAPASAQFLTHARQELHQAKLDRVLAPHDPVPSQAYLAGDIITLVLHNPLLESRLSHYPPLLTLGERKEFQDLATDVDLQQMIQSQGRVSDILHYPKVQAITTNAAISRDIIAIIGDDLPDLKEYLETGKSAKFDSEQILGIWTINLGASVAQARKKTPDITPKQIQQFRLELIPEVSGLSLTATTDNQLILKKDSSSTTLPVIVARGSWKKEGDGYTVTIPANKPDTVTVTIEDGDKLLLPREGHVIVFDKEM
jgi:hypothetical protein